MHWLLELDLALLRFFNQTLSNPFFDAVMPFASGNAFFLPAILIAGIVLLWKGGPRARICVLMLALIIGPGDGYVIATIKRAVERPRPYFDHPDIRLPAREKPSTLKSVEDELVDEDPTPARKPRHRSMPSAHAANWFAATMIFFVYFRRSLWVMLPLACIVSISRLYNGVHYPSDVIAGAIIGSGYAVAGMWLVNALWQFIGRRWFPVWWERMPSLLNLGIRFQTVAPAGMPDRLVSPPAAKAAKPTPDSHWLRLGYALVALMLLGRLIYIGSGSIELSGDEAYQWIWSKHLALSYFSKPLLIALTQWTGTHLWGDSELGVRFFSPVLAALTSLLLLRFVARVIGGLPAVLLLLISTTAPMLSVGSTLMTIDPLLVFFWTAAMVIGWRAVQPDSKTSDWIWVGLAMGLGFLSKYTALLQLVCWVVFFALWQPARIHLRRPGPYLALLVNALCTLPVIIWNAQHQWITIAHVADNAGIGNRWRVRTGEFIGVEALLLNPVFFLAALWAAIAFWRRFRRHSLALYLFSMGTPLFLCYLLWSLRTRILPNWIAPAVLPMFCLMLLYWKDRWAVVGRWAKPIATIGLIFGGFMVVLLHDTDLVGKFVGAPLPPKVDPLTRVRGYSESGRVVEECRQALLQEGKPVFVIGANYQTAGLMTFYLPEAKTNVTKNALVYAMNTSTPRSQFYFWPTYTEHRRGQNAIFVREVGGPPLVSGWIPRWLKGDTNLLQHPHRGSPAPPRLLEEFESVTELGYFHAYYHGRIFHTYQIFECRNLK